MEAIARSSKCRGTNASCFHTQGSDLHWDRGGRSSSVHCSTTIQTGGIASRPVVENAKVVHRREDSTPSQRTCISAAFSNMSSASEQIK